MVLFINNDTSPPQPVAASRLNQLMGRAPNARLSMNDHYVRTLGTALVHNAPGLTPAPGIADPAPNTIVRYSEFYKKYLNPCFGIDITKWQAISYTATHPNSKRTITMKDYFPAMQAGDVFTIIAAIDNQFTVGSGNQVVYAGFTYGTNAGFISSLSSTNLTTYNFNNSGNHSNTTSHLSFYYDGGETVTVFPHYRYGGTATSTDFPDAYMLGMIFGYANTGYQAPSGIYYIGSDPANIKAPFTGADIGTGITQNQDSVADNEGQYWDSTVKLTLFMTLEYWNTVWQTHYVPQPVPPPPPPPPVPPPVPPPPPPAPPPPPPPPPATYSFNITVGGGQVRDTDVGLSSWKWQFLINTGWAPPNATVTVTFDVYVAYAGTSSLRQKTTFTGTVNSLGSMINFTGTNALGSMCGPVTGSIGNGLVFASVSSVTCTGLNRVNYVSQSFNIDLYSGNSGGSYLTTCSYSGQNASYFYNKTASR